ncbi:MAG TPA: hypothetical protein VIH99_09180 [Bdellovibrionota bacterium]|jgi:hypothetical protein
MKFSFSLSFILILGILPSLASARENVGIGSCRAGALEASYSSRDAKESCADVKTDGEGICRAGAMKALKGRTGAKEACADVKTEGDGLCRAGAFRASRGAADAKEICKDL